MCKREHFLVLLEPKLHLTCVSYTCFFFYFFLFLNGQWPPLTEPLHGNIHPPSRVASFCPSFLYRVSLCTDPPSLRKNRRREGRGSAHRLYRVHQMKGSAGREGKVKHSLEKSTKSRSDSLNWRLESYWSLVSSLQSKAGVFCLSANDGTILEGQRFPANWQRVGASPKMIPRVEVTRPSSLSFYALFSRWRRRSISLWALQAT